MSIIKINKYLNFCAVAFCLLVSNVIAKTAFAQWVLPVNNFNLIDNFEDAILALTNWLLGFVVMISVIALVWGGLNYIASAGDAQKADLSKKIIYYSLIGVIISGIAYAVINIIVTEILV